VRNSWRPRLSIVASLSRKRIFRPDHTRQVAVVLRPALTRTCAPAVRGESLAVALACLLRAMAEWRRTDNAGETYLGARCGKGCLLPGHGRRSEVIWGLAVQQTAIGRLGMAKFPELPLPSPPPTGANSLLPRRVPAVLPGDYLRLLLPAVGLMRPGPLRVVAPAQRDRHDAVGLQHEACLAHQAGGTWPSRRWPVVRCRVRAMSGSVRQKAELSARVPSSRSCGRGPCIRRPVAEQVVNSPSRRSPDPCRAAATAQSGPPEWFR